MFRTIARGFANREDLFGLHPLELAGVLEIGWSQKFVPPANPPTVLPSSMPLGILHSAQAINPPVFSSLSPQSRISVDHLIYAYMIENTRIYEIFRRVLYEYLHGERLDIPSVASQQWVRNTEELFYRDPPSFFVFSLRSDI